MLEVFETVKRVSGVDFQVELTGRRAGGFTRGTGRQHHELDREIYRLPRTSGCYIVEMDNIETPTALEGEPF